MARRRIKGEGTIFQRADGRYVARYDGMTRYAKDAYEALDKLNELKAVNKEQLRTKVLTISDMVKPWLNMKAHSLKPQSYDRLESTVELHIIGRIGNLNFEDMSDVVFTKKVLNAMRDEKLSYSSIKKAYDAFNSCMTYYKSKGAIAINPVEAMGAPTKAAYEIYNEDSEGLVIAFTKEQREAFLAALEAKYSNGKPIYKNKDAYILSLYTGVRLGELLALKWSNVNLDKQTVRIASTLTFAKDRDPKSQTFGRRIFRTSSYTKNNKPRVLKLNALAFNSIQTLKKIADEKRSEFVVSSKDGDLVRPKTMEDAFSSICDTAGIDLPSGYNMHVLRHTFASMLFAKGVNVKVVSELLGHSSVQITMNTYIDFIQDQNLVSIQAISDDI